MPRPKSYTNNSEMTRRSSAETQTGAGGSATEGARSSRSRGSTLHLQRWMTQLPESEEMDHPEPDLEMWSVEELRKRSKELNLLEVADIISNHNEKTSGEKKEHERSPSKSSNSGSQITVRTSPVVVDTIPVCRQCHKKCLSKPNSPLISQKEPPKIPAKPKIEPSPQNSIKSTVSTPSVCSAKCGNRKTRNFSNLERKGAMKLRPEDAPIAAAKVIDSIEQSQRMLKSTSYELKTESPILNRNLYTRSAKSQLELRKENSIRSPSPSSSSINNSPLSTSHTTCSSMVFNSSSNDLRMSNSNISNQVQCVIAQEKYLNEVKCVESITLTKSRTSTTSYPSPSSLRKEQITRQKAENVLNKVLGMNILTKRDNVEKKLKSTSVFLDDDSICVHNEDEFRPEKGLRRSPKMGISAVSRMNGDVSKKTERDDVNANVTDLTSDEDVELGPLMLMGLSAINPAAHLMRVEPFKRNQTSNVNNINSRPGALCSAKSESPLPNIAVVPPTPEYNSVTKTDEFVDDSPDSPDVPEDLPYVSLKRYGTMSSLERFPSDETDDGNVRLTETETEAVKPYNQGAAGGIMGWTARAGSFVVEKMNIFSYTESVPSPTPPNRQPTFLERCLGDFKSALGTEEGAETGEGSGASGEDAWGTPSSGDLSDNMPDSEHGTLSSPTKSSSSYAGDDDTELMMDELLMVPTITGPTTLRPLITRDVFRRRLEPLLEEECSDSSSEDNKQTPTNEDQDSRRGRGADDCCDARQPPSAHESEAEGGVARDAVEVGRAGGGPPDGGAACERSPDRTPTNEAPSMHLPYVSKECVEVRAGAGARRGSASSASTPSTLERTTIHNPTPVHQLSPASEQLPEAEDTPPKAPKPLTPEEERLSPRAEMRLALDQGKDMLADQEVSWGGGSDPWSFRAACQRSLLRRVASADAVTLSRAHPRRTAPHTTSRNSVYAWKVPESETKTMEMEQLARVEAQTMRSRTRSQCQNGKILGFLHRRASSDSPRREPLLLGTTGRPFSPRRSSVSNNGYYKICFVNGYV